MTIQQAEIHYQRGEYLNEDGRYDEAIEDFNKVLEFIKAGGVDKSFWLTGGIFRAIANSYRRRNQPVIDKKPSSILMKVLSFYLNECYKPCRV